MTRRPTSVTLAVLLIWALIALALAATVLAVVFDDELVVAWAGGAGLSADDTRVPPSFTPVVVVLCIVVAVLVLVLMSFLQGGHNWARHCLAATMALIALATLSGLRTNPPALFLVFAAVSLVTEALLVACLYHRATTDYVAPISHAGRTHGA